MRRYIFCIIFYLSIQSAYAQQNCVNCQGTDLSWLEELKNSLAEEILNPPPLTPCGSTDGIISTCNYLGQTVFTYLPSSLPCDATRVAVDCNGEILFSYGGFCNGPCPGDAQAQLLTDCEVLYNAPPTPFCDNNCEGSDAVILELSCVNAEVNESNICIDITTQNFIEVSTIQIAIIWDINEIEFISLNEQNLTQISTNESGVNNGYIQILWINSTVATEGISLPDNSLLFQLCFDIIGVENTESIVMFTSQPGFSIELSTGDFAAGNAMLLEHCIQNGQINIGISNDGDMGQLNDEIVSCEEVLIPTMSEWGLVAISLLLLIFGVVHIKSTIVLERS